MGLGYEGEPYLWQDLNAPRLDESVNRHIRKLLRPTTPNDYRLAAASIVDHKSLSSILQLDANASCLSRVIRDLQECGTEGAFDAHSRLEALLLQHRTEWLSFVGGLEPDSWLAQLAEAN